jgi:hypothetical protein
MLAAVKRRGLLLDALRDRLQFDRWKRSRKAESQGKRGYLKCATNGEGRMTAEGGEKLGLLEEKAFWRDRKFQGIGCAGSGGKQKN